MGKILVERIPVAVVIIVAIWLAARYIVQIVDLEVLRDTLGIAIPEQGTIILGLALVGALATMLWSVLKITPFLGIQWDVGDDGIMVHKPGSAGTLVTYKSVVRITYSTEGLGGLLKYSTVKAELTNAGLDKIDMEYVSNAVNYVTFISDQATRARQAEAQPSFEQRVGGVMDRM